MNRNSSIASAAVSDDVLAEIYHTQHSEPSNKEDQTTDDSGWMQKREIHQVKNTRIMVFKCMAKKGILDWVRTRILSLLREK